MPNLSEFELSLYEDAKKAGFGFESWALGDGVDVMLRIVIEAYLRHVWKDSLVKFENIKEKLDPSLYNLGDAAVDELVPLLKEGNFSVLGRRLKENPGLINRRDKGLRTLLHHALIGGNSEAAVQFLLERGAFARIPSEDGVYPLHLIVQKHLESYLVSFLSYLNKSMSAYEILHSMLMYNAVEATCVVIYQKTAQFIDPKAKAHLLDFSIIKGYYHLTETLVCDGAPLNIKYFHGNTPLHRLGKSRQKEIGETAGIVSLLLAAGADPRQLDASNQTAAENAAVKKDSDSRDTIIRSARMYSELLLCGEDKLSPSVVILPEERYNKLNDANLLVTDNIIYFVFNISNQALTYTINYMKQGIPQRLIVDSNVYIEGLIFLIYYPSIHRLYSRDGHERGYWGRPHENKKEIFDSVRRRTLEMREFALNRVDAQPLSLDLTGLDNEARAIQFLKRTFGDGPIPLYDERVQWIFHHDRDLKFEALRLAIFSQVRVLEDPKSLKYFLYHSAAFFPTSLHEFLVNQPFPADVPFYQFILNTGIPFRKKQPYSEYSVERQAAGFIALARKNKRPVDSKTKARNPVGDQTAIDELDLLKRVKLTYFYQPEKLKNDQYDKNAYTAIRDNLVLALPTLFLNVIRCNRDLTKLKDTRTYVKICKLVDDVDISPEAKDELKKRVAVAQPSLRDVALYLALACDFEQEKAVFIQVCRDHLLSENPSVEQKAALNAGLRLLSESDHEILRGRLIEVSKDEALLPALQVCLPKKNCAFIEIIRTSAEHREVKDTGTFKTWAAELKKIQLKLVEPPVVEPKPESSNGGGVGGVVERGVVRMLLKVGLLAPKVDPEKHNANVGDRESPDNPESGMNFLL